MASIDNVTKFPNNIFPPKTVEVNGISYTVYQSRFTDLYDLYQYLKGSPHINRKVFPSLESEENDFAFAGKPYKEAVEDLIKEVDPGYEEFLELQKALNSGRQGTVHKYRTVKTVAGGHLHIPSYSAGAPLCYETEERVIKPKFIGIHATLSYRSLTTKAQVFNRAVIITNILKALEKAGYSVNLNTFKLAENSDELVHCVIQMKNYGGHLNMNALYQSLCHVEFARRILFRLLETTDVKTNWHDGYGSTCDEDFAKAVLKLNKQDLYFSTPNEMGIEGENIVQDFETVLECLNLCDKIDVEQVKHNFRKNAESYQKRKKL